jgi:hypothetical protein
MIMTDVVVDDVQAMSPAPVFRALQGAAAACRLVSGQECFGPATAVRQAQSVQSVSGAVLAGAAGFLGLVALGEGLLERHGYVGLLGQERPRPVFSEPVQAQLSGRDQAGEQGDEQAQSDGSGIAGDSYASDGNDSNKRDNGSKPMTPWGFRTSSPPG